MVPIPSHYPEDILVLNSYGTLFTLESKHIDRLGGFLLESDRMDLASRKSHGVDCAKSKPVLVSCPDGFHHKVFDQISKAYNGVGIDETIEKLQEANEKRQEAKWRNKRNAAVRDKLGQ